MFVRENTRREIETKLEKMGDYVKIDYLSSCLKNPLDFDARKFVLMTLAELYEKRRMFLEAGKMMRAAAPINTTFKWQIDSYLKSSEFFVKAGKFDEADISFERALACGTEKEKLEIRQKRISSYKEQAEFYLKNDKRQNAVVAYEKLLSLNLGAAEKKDVQNKLLGLYERLGKIREFYNLKRVL